MIELFNNMEYHPNDIFNDRYALKRLLGRGAFGEVWHAKDEFADTDVAIKIYVALDELGLHEFREEFKIVYDLHHPNLLRPEHYDIAGKQPYLVMPLCKGSVSHLAGNMKEEELWHLIHDISRGLAYLHRKDILHRDIKPDNILIANDFVYLLSDFGVSKKLQNTMRRNSTCQKMNSDVSGTVPYMAPELFSKNPIVVKATDIWAFGVTLFELMTGELLFAGQGGILQSKGAEIPNMPDFYSEGLKSLVEDCLSFDTWKRPTAEQIEEYSATILRGQEQIPPWRAEDVGHKPKSFSNVLLYLTLSLISVALLCFGVYHYWPKLVAEDSTQESSVTPISHGENSIQLDKEVTIIENESQLEYNEQENTFARPQLSQQQWAPASSDTNEGALQLKYGEWQGGVKNGKPDGQGVLIIRGRHTFNGVQTEDGYRLEGTFDNGDLVIGKLFDDNNNLLKTIMP